MTMSRRQRGNVVNEIHSLVAWQQYTEDHITEKKEEEEEEKKKKKKKEEEAVNLPRNPS